MFNCLYCGEAKVESDSSVEHAVPQFLGGDAVPKRFHLTNVCTRCNSTLGLFVDAAYAKAWTTTNALTNAARVLCASKNDPGLPLSYIGHSCIEELRVPEGHVAEHWIGPFGETVIWVRAHDERMNVYAGGNPIDAKRKPSVVYFFPTRTDEIGFQLGLSSLERMFKKKQVRKILSAKIVDEVGDEVAGTLLGFELPDATEAAALEAIRAQIKAQTMHARAGMVVNFDHRFVCKLALGIGYAIFGEAFLQEPYTKELRRGLWQRNDDEIKPHVRGHATFVKENDLISKITHYPGAVVISILPSKNDWTLTLTLDETLSFTVAMAPATLTSNIDFEEGYALVLVPYLEQAFEVTGAQLIAHKLGLIPHPQLQALDQRRRDANVFWTKLMSNGIT